MYTILDLLDKFIDIEKNAYSIYEKISEAESFSQPIRTMARVLAREEKRHIQIYGRIKEELKDKEDIDIDFQLYDKSYKALSSFTKRSSNIKMESTSELLQYALDFEKENLSLAITVRGILMRTLGDEKTKAYEVLSELIREENRHIENIEKFLNNR